MRQFCLIVLCMFMLAGCASVNDTVTEEVAGTPEVTSTPEATPEETPMKPWSPDREECQVLYKRELRTIKDGYKRVNIYGLFDVEIIDPMPEQMEFYSSKDKNGDEGYFEFVIRSSDPGCIIHEECRTIPYGFNWFTDQALEEYKKLMPFDDWYIIEEYDTSLGHISVCIEPTVVLNGEILDGNGPDYLILDCRFPYALEDLIRFIPEGQ